MKQTGVEYHQARAEDFDFLWGLHRSELKPYVEPIWGWDEVWQLDRFRKHFDPTDQRIILHRGQAVGTVKVVAQDDRIFLGYIVIAPAYQGRGLGTAVIREVIEGAENKGLPVRLQVLQGNPARRLYERLGFEITQETDIHLLMERVSRSAKPRERVG